MQLSHALTTCFKHMVSATRDGFRGRNATRGIFGSQHPGRGRHSSLSGTLSCDSKADQKQISIHLLLTTKIKKKLLLTHLVELVKILSVCASIDNSRQETIDCHPGSEENRKWPSGWCQCVPVHLKAGWSLASLWAAGFSLELSAVIPTIDRNQWLNFAAAKHSWLLGDALEFQHVSGYPRLSRKFDASSTSMNQPDSSMSRKVTRLWEIQCGNCVVVACREGESQHRLFSCKPGQCVMVHWQVYHQCQWFCYESERHWSRYETSEQKKQKANWWRNLAKFHCGMTNRHQWDDGIGATLERRVRNVTSFGPSVFWIFLVDMWE